MLWHKVKTSIMFVRDLTIQSCTISIEGVSLSNSIFYMYQVMCPGFQDGGYIVIKWLQFQVKVSVAMPINKAQRQCLNITGFTSTSPFVFLMTNFVLVVLAVSTKKENLSFWKVFRERFYKDFHHHHHYYLYEKLNLI